MKRGAPSSSCETRRRRRIVKSAECIVSGKIASRGVGGRRSVVVGGVKVAVHCSRTELAVRGVGQPYRDGIVEAPLSLVSTP